jgi:hypothetical protein
MGHRGWRLARSSVNKVPFINLEFHAIDMTDHALDNIDDVLLRQPDQRTPLAEKTTLFNEVLSHLKEGWENRTLEEVAKIQTAVS